MSKLLKYTAIAFGLLIMVIIVIPFVVDLNDYKPQISKIAKEAIGRDLTIEGDIKLSLFPWIGMKLGAAQLSNAAGFGDQPFGRIEAAEVKIKLLPLLKHEVEMKSITLQGLQLNLSVAADGRNNWSDLARGGNEAAPAQAPETTSSSAATTGLASLAIGGLALSDARLVYDNRATGARYTVDQLNLSTGPVALNAPLDIELHSKISSSTPDVSGTLALKVRVIAGMKTFSPQRLEKLHLTLDFNSPRFNSSGQLALDSNIDLDLPQQRYSLSPMTLTANISNPSLPGGTAALRLAADINANLQQQTAQVSNLRISSNGLDIQGMINASNIMTTPLLNGDLRVAEFNPRTLLGIAAPATADPKVLNKAALELKLVDSTASTIHIKPFTLTLDDSTLQGTIDVELGNGKPLPAVRYQLSLDAIDADRYLPPHSDKNAAAPAASSGAAAAAQLPMELLRNLDIDGTAAIGKLTLSKLHLDEIHTTLKAKDGVIRLAPVGARLYQGSYAGDSTLDARGKRLQLTLKESLQNIQAGPLLKDFMNNDLISGKGSLNLALTAQGHTPDEITRTLNGAINLNFANIAMKGLNIAAKAREAMAKIKGEAPPANDTRPTDFSEVKGTFQVHNGVVSGTDLSAKTPFARVNGAGKIDLVQKSLDYLVTAKIVASATGEGGADLDALKGLILPVRITGPFTKLDFNPQYDDILKQKLSQTKAALQERLDQEKAKLKADADARLQAEKQKLQQRLQSDQKLQEQKQKAEEALKEKLKGLFNR